VLQPRAVTLPLARAPLLAAALWTASGRGSSPSAEPATWAAARRPGEEEATRARATTKRRVDGVGTPVAARAARRARLFAPTQYDPAHTHTHTHAHKRPQQQAKASGAAGKGGASGKPKAAAANGTAAKRPRPSPAAAPTKQQQQQQQKKQEQKHPLVRAVDDAAAYVRARIPEGMPPPQVALVLGSGLGGLADDLDAPGPRAEVRYGDVPGFHASAVQGHPGRLLLGALGGTPVLVLQGRFHYYEGHAMESVALPVRLARALGCHTVVLTNAAGGLDPAHRPGDLMLITDHLNLVGANPLRGPNPPGLFGGPRFLDQSRPYDPDCCEAVRRAAAALGQRALREGVYAGVAGPTYETPAETRMLRLLGAHAVGMSTVPEAIAAAHAGLRVVGVSNITNAACGSADQPVSHDEVMAMSAQGADKLRALLRTAVPQMAVGGKYGPKAGAGGAANGSA
jgi:purine-nucleoside phosphorylase